MTSPVSPSETVVSDRLQRALSRLYLAAEEAAIRAASSPELEPQLYEEASLSSEDQRVESHPPPPSAA